MDINTYIKGQLSIWKATIDYIKDESMFSTTLLSFSI